MKKSLALLTALVMALGFTLTGCGDNKEDTSLADVQAKGELVMGLDDSFPPMGFRDEDQNIVGFDVDVAKEVAAKMGVELKLQPIDWNSKEQELSTGNVDCLWNGFTKTEQRDKEMNLSEPYMKNTQVVVVLADSGINSIADLAGKVVDVQSGSSAELAIDNMPDFKDSVKELTPSLWTKSLPGTIWRKTPAPIVCWTNLWQMKSMSSALKRMRRAFAMKYRNA